MKALRVGFDTETYGTLTIRDGKIEADGPNVTALRELAEHYVEVLVRAGEEDPTPERLLEFMAERLQGRQWATPVDGTQTKHPAG